ncbi:MULTISPECIES: helix-turn-helix domain-containing protein [Paenibacillus]|uniref:Helix-turn-helix domain-containing protein n=1 Tax=Paenibacillus xylanilyticus TaxID=248903 RepID=A0A7Y6EV49_9BACL|nr:RodZ family helix-turn-helix domain-containing protein [Paenibacillus xylanilyticus]NUU76286.1 helix-turn-helix domain-containing protein [Paenibacillus xylanilyticus]
MSELGQQLREARLQKGMSLDDVQEMTKIRKRYLEAIEAGDYKVLPGSFYVRAFIKTYAETVGLNPDELLEGHKKDVPAEETEATMEPVIQKRSSRPVERSNRWMSVALMWTFPILIVALLYVYVVMNKDDADTQGVDQTKITDSQQQPNDQPDETTDNGQASTPPTNEAGGEETGQGDGEAGGNGGGTDVTDQTDPEGQTDEQTPDGTEDEENTDNAGAVVVAEDGKSGNITNFKVNGSAGKPVKVTINASGQSWLEVYKGENSSGEKLQFGMTADGDSMSFDLDSTGLYIKSGYAAATTIEVGGQVVTDGKATNRIRLQLGDESTSTSTETNGGSAEGSGAGNEGSGTGSE